MESITSIIAAICDWIWGAPMIVLLTGTHLFLTIRLRFPQRHIFKAIKLSVLPDGKSVGDVSPFASLATSLAATIGTGNIIGIATAVALGGPGAVFWCWITGILGIATKYGEGVLAVKYRVENSKGLIIGGPMYALDRGLNCKWLAVLFCVFTALAAFGIGNTIQANSIAEVTEKAFSVSPYVTGTIISLLTALTILFGVKSIARICSRLVPVMALFYIAGSLLILYFNRAYLWNSVQLILSSAFSAKAATGGFVGSTIAMTMRYGIARGLFSSESGLGSAPIIAAASQARNAVRQGLISSTGTFWDTVVICAITGLVIVSSILAHPDIDSSHGATLTYAAFEKIPYIGRYILFFSLVSFSFSTLLGWSYYGEKAIEYLGGLRMTTLFRICWVVAIFIGSVTNLSVLWNVADIMNALMALPNLVSLVGLSGVLVAETRAYLWDDRLNSYDESLEQIVEE